MQTFQFAPPNIGIGDTKKNYVFVDEHNRHKRLKVMRACEGCRRRKIRCDAATTNSWPCAACVRLKLQCVPPTVNYNQTHANAGNVSGLERVLDFDNSSGGSGDEDYGQGAMGQNVFQLSSGPETISASHAPYSGSLGASYAPSYDEKTDSHSHYQYDSVTSIPLTTSESPYHTQTSFHLPSLNQVHLPDNSQWSQPQEEVPSAEGLSEALGELHIDETGKAPYVYNQKKALTEAPALEEYETVRLPAVSTGSGAAVRIPPELMPTDEQAMRYFEVFFSNIHPYVPVISERYFYQEWHTNRKDISPLLLEAIFACAGRMMPDDAAQGAQWLALASKHEDCFMDVPRLSTVQALLILLKARESAPKRGYYYRSWMTIKTLVAMAKDLEMHEHLEDHEQGRGCDYHPVDCLVRTRIWQTIYMCEMMVAGPQGRFDLGVDTDTVDNRILETPPGANDDEYQISRNFTYMVRTVRNVRVLNDVYVKIRKQKDWGSNPHLLNLNGSFPKFLQDLPPDMQIHYPSDGSPPWLPSTFIGNMHCYYLLSNILLHRPQLMKSTSFAAGGSWKQHMTLCYDSAKKLCRIQEALLQTYRIEGLICMQRGINFAIYCILSCTMLHLVAITSPDPDFSSDAKDYFTRHMRILESCIPAWPMADMQAQIHSLREAFSRNTNKVFELKPSFPYSSPVARLQPSPPVDSYQEQKIRSQPTHEQTPHLHYHPTPITPPISTGGSKDGSLDTAPLPMMQHHLPSSMPSSHIADENLAWDPTRIFEYGAKPPPLKLLEPRVVRSNANPPRSQWTTAFGTPSSTMSASVSSLNQQSQSPTMYTPSASGSDLPHLHDAMQQQQQPQFALPPNMMPVPQMQPPPPQQQQAPPYAAPGHSYVSPSMWQDTVASTYDPSGSLKRRWDMGASAYMNDQTQVKRPR
ncbi:hypothetical protein MMC30_000017 [Trapelia coarctata]|nr:hypothetical protein [Trapelia coarctata]